MLRRKACVQTSACNDECNLQDNEAKTVKKKIKIFSQDDCESDNALSFNGKLISSIESI